MAAKDADKTMISLQIPAKTAAALTRKAEKEGISRSALIRNLLTAGMKGRADSGSELRRLREEVERLGRLVEASIKERE